MENTTDKVQVYEKFLNEKLRSDLKRAMEEQEKIYSEIAEYLQIKDTAQKLQTTRTDGKKLNTKVDLGCNFYANAVVEDCSKIFVAVGYGFFLEMKLDECIRFVDKKVKQLDILVKELDEKVAEIKANIKFVLEGLKEIQNLEFGEKPQRSLFI